jgi:hypothetical protein
MAQSPPSPPRTIIVVDDYPSDVSSFICSVLDAHALPYAVQVLNPGAPAFAHLAPHEPRRAPTLILLHRLRSPRAGQVFWRRLTALWLAVTPLCGLRRLTQRPTAARPSTPRRLRWPRGLAWGVGLGLVVSLVAGVPLLWQAGPLPRLPSSPPPRSAHTATVLLGAAAPAAPPVAEARPPAQSQTPVAPARITGATLGGPPAGGLLPRPYASVAQNAASLRPQAIAQPRAARVTRVRHTRRRYVPLPPAPRPHTITARDDAETSTRPRVVGADRPGEWSAALPTPQPPWWRVAPDPALEVERPWNRRLVNDTGA